MTTTVGEKLGNLLAQLDIKVELGTEITITIAETRSFITTTSYALEGSSFRTLDMNQSKEVNVAEVYVVVGDMSPIQLPAGDILTHYFLDTKNWNLEDGLSDNTVIDQDE